MSEVVFTTERLAMRTWREGDDALVLAIQTPGFMRWLQDDDMPQRRPGSPTERMHRMVAEHGFCFWAAERLSDGVFIGYCGLKRVDAEGTDLVGAFEIGWGFGEAHQGQGYATEAARASLDRAFAVHDAPFVVAFTVAGNVRSWRLMERLGMARHPEFDFHDPAFSAALNPTITYLIRRDAWSARSPC